jgi:hypothetical protein
MQLVRANQTEWIGFCVSETVIVSPNLTSPLALSWLCEHAAPQKANGTGEQIIACDPCYESLKAGADIAYDM